MGCYVLHTGARCPGFSTWVPSRHGGLVGGGKPVKPEEVVRVESIKAGEDSNYPVTTAITR